MPTVAHNGPTPLHHIAIHRFHRAPLRANTGSAKLLMVCPTRAQLRRDIAQRWLPNPRGRVKRPARGNHRPANIQHRHASASKVSSAHILQVAGVQLHLWQLNLRRLNRVALFNAQPPHTLGHHGRAQRHAVEVAHLVVQARTVL